MRKLLVIWVLVAAGLGARAQLADTSYLAITSFARAGNAINDYQHLWGQEYMVNYENAQILHGLVGWQSLNGNVGRRRVEFWMLKEDPRFDRFGLPIRYKQL